LAVDYHTWAVHFSARKVATVNHSVLVENVAQALVLPVCNLPFVFLDFAVFRILNHAFALLRASIKKPFIDCFIGVDIQSLPMHFSLSELSIIVVPVGEFHLAFSFEKVIEEFAFVLKIIRLINAFPVARTFEKLPFIGIFVRVMIFSSSVDVSFAKNTFYFFPCFHISE
jgi:hypothetical protein